ncbi:MAG: HAD hydrolase family protein, partial [Bacilli bacterium]|nr:HAD hydrolase family protein [Bacilli bacterium]
MALEIRGITMGYSKEFKLLAVDIDGTLLNSSGVLTTKTLQLITELNNQDYIFVLSTGRPLIGAKA